MKKPYHRRLLLWFRNVKKKEKIFWFALEIFVCFFDLFLISKLDKLQAGKGKIYERPPNIGKIVVC